MEKEYPFYIHQEDNDEVVAEFRIITAKPEGERIDEETLNIIRARLADRLEAQWTDPKDLLLVQDATQIIELLRSGKRIADNGETNRVLSQLLQDYRLSPDERDKAKENIFETK